MAASPSLPCAQAGARQVISATAANIVLAESVLVLDWAVQTLQGSYLTVQQVATDTRKWC